MREMHWAKRNPGWINCTTLTTNDQFYKECYYTFLCEMMWLFTRPQRKADVPKARPTRNQLGLAVSGLELVNTDLDPTKKKTQYSMKNHTISMKNEHRSQYLKQSWMEVSISVWEKLTLANLVEDDLRPFINTFSPHLFQFEHFFSFMLSMLRVC